MRYKTLLVAGFFVAVSAVFGQENVANAVKPMARNADPAFDVSVIKPSDPNDHSDGFHLKGHRISIENMTLESLICFAYSIHQSQIIGAPKWIDDQHWDIDGVPDTDGQPNLQQYQIMVKKMLFVRFGLQMHRDKRELAGFALTVAKGGPKLKKSEYNSDAPPEQNGNGMGTMKFVNNSMSDLAFGLQYTVLKPVVDRTNLSGRYDFILRWTPEDNGATSDAPPTFFTAIQEELGLKLESVHAPMDVLVIDAATKPTPN